MPKVVHFNPQELKSHHFIVRNDNDADMVDYIDLKYEIYGWCEQEFGREHGTWYNHGSVFALKDEKEAALFKLRWC